VSPNEQAFYRHAGQRIRFHRLRMGLTQQVLGDRTHIGRPTLAYIEAGRQRIDAYRLGQLAHVFGVTADELIRGPVPEAFPRLIRSRPGLLSRLRKALS
jgi:transcriptional regulator with XRE-family HTH domain